MLGAVAAASPAGAAPAQAASSRRRRITSCVFLDEVLVGAPANGRAVALCGDSITDGDGSTVDADHRWPDLLADRLHGMGAAVALLKEGISGDRVLADRLGDNALARFDRDVLRQPGVGTVVLMMGINDIGWPGSALSPKNEVAPSADDIIAGYRQLIARAHEDGLRIVGATLTPFEDAFGGRRSSATTATTLAG